MAAESAATKVWQLADSMVDGSADLSVASLVYSLVS
jgi:hypothetical protein